MADLLIVDDESHIREVLRFALEQAGHRVTEAADAASARLRFATQQFDLVVLDIVLPDEDGLELCRRFRATSRVPIVFLSSRDEELDRILGLELGADDYLTKPFSPRELVARVKAVLRRSQPPPPPPTDGPTELVHGPLVMDLVRHELRWGERPLVLTVTEFALLRCLLTAPGRVFTRGDLVDRVYGHGHVITERTMDSHIRRIRKKFADLGADPLETVYGLGYRLADPLPPAAGIRG